LNDTFVLQSAGFFSKNNVLEEVYRSLADHYKKLCVTFRLAGATVHHRSAISDNLSSVSGSFSNKANDGLGKYPTTATTMWELGLV